MNEKYFLNEDLFYLDKSLYKVSNDKNIRLNRKNWFSSLKNYGWTKLRASWRKLLESNYFSVLECGADGDCLFHVIWSYFYVEVLFFVKGNIIPYFKNILQNYVILDKFGDEYKIVTAPGPSEINDAKNINALALLDNGKALDISQLTALIQNSTFVIANDTGPAHIAAHVGAKGLTLFGKHTTAYKVSIERKNFKAIEVKDLNNLSAEKVFERLNMTLS